MTKERISYIDFGAGIMILWMILGHAFMAAGFTSPSVQRSGLTDYIPNFLFFFMPWFFYKSGQFFNKKNRKDSWSKDWRKLIQPFLVWSAIGYISYLISLVVYDNFTFRNVIYLVVRHFVLGGSIDLNHPLWFLLTLFGVRQIANIILPYENDKYYLQKNILITLVAYSIGLGLYCLNCRFVPIWIANGSTGLAYFTLGYCMQKYETKWMLFVPSLFVYIVCCVWGFPGIDMHSNYCENAIRYVVSLPASFAGIVVFNFACDLIAKYLHYLSLPFEKIGKYAMIIYVSHGIIYGSVPWIIDLLHCTLTYTCALCVILGSYVIFLPLLCILSQKISDRGILDKIRKIQS